MSKYLVYQKYKSVEVGEDFLFVGLISLSGISKCGDRGKKIKIKLSSKMYHMFAGPSELFLLSTCCEVLRKF